MGLDMYLNAKRYLYREKDKEIVDVIKAEQISGMGDMRPKEITCPVMYWRKANHIHRWFVEQVQDRTDDCGEYEVMDRQLRELVGICKQVLSDRSLAPKLLPVQEGFFFGGKDYEDWYFEDVKATVEALDKVLSTEGIEEWNFYYRSSW
jgi:hypothetical protein